MNRNKTIFLIFMAFMLQTACVKENDTPLSSDKFITSFVFKAAMNPTLQGDIAGTVGKDSIIFMFPSGSVITNLIPEIEFTGKSISPENKTAGNFSQPISYTVTAGDGTEKRYTVISEVIPSNARSIDSFFFKTADNAGLPEDATGIIRNDSIFLTVLYGTDITSLVPSIVFTGKSISPANLIAQNFTNVISYAVKGENDSTRVYQALVTIAPKEATLFINSRNVNNDEAFIYAIDPNTGSMKWKYDYPADANSAGIEFNSGLLFSTFSNYTVAIDTATKGLRWQYAMGGITSSTPVWNNGSIYINCNDSYLYAFDATTGGLKWRYAEILPVPANSDNMSSPCVANGVVYAGSLDGYIHAVNVNDGSLKWKVKAGVNQDLAISCSPVVVNGTLYVGAPMGNLVALDAATGNLKWSYYTGGVVFGSPTIANNVVYCTSVDNYLYAIDANTGILKWKFTAPRQIFSSPLVENGVVYIAELGGSVNNIFSNKVYAMDAATGTIKWSYEDIEAAFMVSPVLYDETLFIPNGRSLLAIDCKVGTLKWKFTPAEEENMPASATIVDKDGNIYYSSVSGNRN